MWGIEVCATSNLIRIIWYEWWTGRIKPFKKKRQAKLLQHCKRLLAERLLKTLSLVINIYNITSLSIYPNKAHMMKNKIILQKFIYDLCFWIVSEGWFIKYAAKYSCNHSNDPVTCLVILIVEQIRIIHGAHMSGNVAINVRHPWQKKEQKKEKHPCHFRASLGLKCPVLISQPPSCQITTSFLWMLVKQRNRCSTEWCTCAYSEYFAPAMNITGITNGLSTLCHWVYLQTPKSQVDLTRLGTQPSNLR